MKRKVGLMEVWFSEKDFYSLEEVELIDLGFIGDKFTWSNKEEGSSRIIARLDRACSNVIWSDQFPQARLYHLLPCGSDHAPILLNTDPNIKGQKNRCFRFKNFWVEDDDFQSVIMNAWCTPTDSQSSHSNIALKIN